MTDKPSISTDEFDPTLFRPHGRVNFTIDGNLLLCEAVGPFNKELVLAIAEVEIGLIQKLAAQGRWADIVIVKENVLSSTDTLEAYTGYLNSLGASAMHSNATAMVIGDDVEGAVFMVPLIIKAYADAGIKLNVFKTIDEAKVWVRKYL
jgi:hypothetical protein